MTDATNTTAAPAPAKTIPGVLKRTNAFFLDPAAITRKLGFNPRFDFGEIAELAKSILANGLLQPIRVRKMDVPGKFELIDGDRRFTAIELLGAKFLEKFPDGVHSIVVDKSLSEIDALLQMFESNSAKAFLPLEEAAAYKRMRDAGMTIKEIELRVGRSDNAIVGALALFDGDATLIEATRTGAISGGLAKSIAVNARGDKAKQQELVADAKAAGKDKVKRKAVKAKIEAARVVKAKKEGRKLKMRALTDEQLTAVGSKLSEHLFALMGQLGLDAESDLVSYIETGTLDQKVGFTFGVLQGLKAAAGVDARIMVD